MKIYRLLIKNNLLELKWKKTHAYKFFDKEFYVDEYSEMYRKAKTWYKVSGKCKRFKIFLDLIKKHKPKNIVDAGCGAGMPLVLIKKKVIKLLVMTNQKIWSKAKANLRRNKLPMDLVFYDDFENPKNVKNNSVDCILGMGAFYYSKNVNKTLLNQRKKLKKMVD